MAVTIKTRFWQKVDQQAIGCWIWIGAKSGGYGSYRHQGHTVRAHRLIWESLQGAP